MGGEARIACARQNAARNGAMSPNARRCSDKIRERLLKALIPEDRSERTMIRFRLRQAGFDGPNSVRNFFVLRLALAMLAPFIVLLIFLCGNL
jgi:tight adherence protein C